MSIDSTDKSPPLSWTSFRVISLPWSSKYEDLPHGEQIDDYSMNEFRLMFQPLEPCIWRKEEEESEEKETEKEEINLHPIL